jgi:hypothetical protein
MAWNPTKQIIEGSGKRHTDLTRLRNDMDAKGDKFSTLRAKYRNGGKGAPTYEQVDNARSDFEDAQAAYRAAGGVL